MVDPMKGRSKASGGKQNRHKQPYGAIRPTSSASEESDVARLTRELHQALEQQAATSEVLGVISSSPGELEQVFQSILEKATRICEANFSTLFRFDGKVLQSVAQFGTPSELIEGPARLELTTPGGLLDQLSRTKQVIHTTECAADAIHGLAARFGAARSVVGVPLLKDDALLGAIIIYGKKFQPFSDKQIEFVQSFAAQAVIAIENARLLNELRQRTTDLTERTADLTEALEQQTATSEVLQVISSSPGDLQPVFATMLENAVRICDAQFGMIFRWQDDVLLLVATYNTPPAFAEFRRRSPLRPHPQLVGRAVATEKAIHVADLAAEQPYIEQRDPGYVAAVERGGVRTFLAVPMLKENVLIGLFTVYRQEVRPFTDKQIALVTNFAAQAVIAIENARLLYELRQRTDDLTEALEQQTATTGVLQIISASPSALETVFHIMLKNATRICDAAFGSLLLRDGDAYRRVALHNAPLRFSEFSNNAPILRRGIAPSADRVIETRNVVHIFDMATEEPETPIAKFGGARTLLNAPLLKENEAIGVIGIPPKFAPLRRSRSNCSRTSPRKP